MGLGIGASQAACIELKPLEDITDTTGEIHFGIYLSDMGTLPNIDLFNIALGITDGPGIQLRLKDDWGITDPEYLFNENSFAYTWTNPSENSCQFGVMDLTSNYQGVDISEGNLLALITIDYNELNPGTLSFYLLEGQNFVQSDMGSGKIQENLSFSPGTKTSITVVPIPGSFLLMSMAVLGLIQFKRKMI
jgi:hypothetical protein